MLLSHLSPEGIDSLMVGQDVIGVTWFADGSET